MSFLAFFYRERTTKIILIFVELANYSSKPQNNGGEGVNLVKKSMAGPNDALLFPHFENNRKKERGEKARTFFAKIKLALL